MDVRVAIWLIGLMYERFGDPVRPVYGDAVKMASRVLNLSLRSDGRWHRWGYWKRRLGACGLDADDPVRVIDERRWALAWEQLRETGTIREAVLARDVALGREAPVPGEELVAVSGGEIKRGEGLVSGRARFKMPKL